MRNKLLEGAYSPYMQMSLVRVWPGVVAVVLQWFFWLALPQLAPDMTAMGMIGGILGGGLAVLVWWGFFSRVPMMERLGALVLMPMVAIAARPFMDASIQGGMMGMMFWFMVVPTFCLALVVWAALRQGRVALVAALLLGSAAWGVMRTDGVMGEGKAQWALRWTKNPEQKLLVMEKVEPVVAEKPKVIEAPTPVRMAGSWPGFRGLNRDDRVTGVRISTDWTASPPKEMWRRSVGPGWSSFAVGDGLIYTQEQRGEFEVVSCYDLATGKPVWTHKDAARFYESNAGAGPRGTPALHGGWVYTLGATGVVNALDAASGRVAWTHDAAKDTGATLPGWGFSASPLVVDDLVIVAASGRMAAYDLATGDLRWKDAVSGGSYSSPHLMTIGGVEQLVMLNIAGAAGVMPSNGAVLWKHEWAGMPMLQPALTADGGVLVYTNDMAGGMGTRRLAVVHGEQGWKADAVWTSNGLKPYFNDIVVQNGHAYGFDGGILACIELQEGKRKWKGGRYGHGQMVLLADQGLLLVLSEEGELALVSASPEEFKELGRVRALEGKTWNHMAVAGEVLLVRNGEEMVAFRVGGRS